MRYFYLILVLISCNTTKHETGTMFKPTLSSNYGAIHNPIFITNDTSIINPLKRKLDSLEIK